MDLELFMPSQDRVLVEGIVPSRKLQKCDSKDQLCQLSNCLGIPRAKPPATQRFQKPSLSSGLPNAEPLPARVVPAYPCTPDLCFIGSPFSFLLSCVTRFFEMSSCSMVSCARDEGLPVELSTVRLHVSNSSGRNILRFMRLGEGMPIVLVLGRQRGWCQASRGSDIFVAT
jgi:hypothetical protein